ncbi:MAG: response regulator [Gammaproteobacteria bacterium]
MNILVVDDNAASLYMLMVLLPAHGHSLETAANGMEALEKLNTKNFDLIVSDILMPKMDGFEFCRTVRAEPRWTNIPFIFYTATYTSEADERFALNVGADRFLIKPMAPDLLIQNIRDAYEQKKTAKPQSKPAAPEGGETFLREYNERLINKLEDKMLQVEREKERYRVTLSAISDGVIAVDAQHRVVHMNPAAEHLTGWIGAAAHGLSLEAVCPLLSEHAHEPFADPVARCIEDGRFVEPTESLVVRDRDGTDRAVDIVVSCSRDRAAKYVATF